MLVSERPISWVDYQIHILMVIITGLYQSRFAHMTVLCSDLVLHTSEICMFVLCISCYVFYRPNRGVNFVVVLCGCIYFIIIFLVSGIRCSCVEF